MKKEFLFIASYLLASCLLQAKTQDDSTRVVNLEAVVVSVVRAQPHTPVAQTTLQRTQIDEARNGRDLPFVLELLPSVVSYSDNGTGLGTTGFRIRGSDASRTNISIDGVPLNDAESQSVFWVNIPDLGAISQSLQVQRGVGTSAFGSSAFGGLLNIETRPAAQQAGTHWEASYGAFGTWNAAANVSTGLLHDAFTFDARYEYVSSDGYLEHSGLWQQSLRAQASWRGRRQLLKAAVLYGEQHSMLTYEGVPFDSLATNRRAVYTEYANGYYPNETDNYRQTHAHLHYTFLPNEAWRLHATAYYTKGAGYYEQYKTATGLAKYGIPAQAIDGTPRSRSDLIRRKGLDNDFFGVNVAALYSVRRWHLTVGAAANRYVGDHYGKVLWTQYNAGGIDYNRDWYANNGTKEEINLFAKASFQFLPAFSAFADVQVRAVGFQMEGLDDDYYEKQAAAYPPDPSAGVLDLRYSWLFVNPKAGISYAPNERHSAFASVAVGNREPNRSDLKDADKNNIRTPATAERLYDWEAGYVFRPAFGHLGVNLYYMNYHNQIVATGRLNDAYREVMENVPESYRAGVEITATVRPAPRWQLDAAFTWSRNKLRNYTHYSTMYDNSTDWNPVAPREERYREATIAYSPPVVASGAVRWTPLDKLSLALTGKYVGKQFYDNTQTDSRSLDAYLVNHLQVRYDFTVAPAMHGFVQLAVNNLFDVQYCSWAFVNDFAAFADGSPDYQDRRYFPQAGRHWMIKTGWTF
jgi:iron complex outermembrane receptor protein